MPIEYPPWGAPSREAIMQAALRLRGHSPREAADRAVGMLRPDQVGSPRAAEDNTRRDDDAERTLPPLP